MLKVGIGFYDTCSYYNIIMMPQIRKKKKDKNIKTS